MRSSFRSGVVCHVLTGPVLLQAPSLLLMAGRCRESSSATTVTFLFLLQNNKQKDNSSLLYKSGVSFNFVKCGYLVLYYLRPQRLIVG